MLNILVLFGLYFALSNQAWAGPAIPTHSSRYSDCQKIKTTTNYRTRIYEIQPPLSPSPFEVYCQMDKKYGWTVIQRRTNGKANFDRGWKEYKEGFGELTGEFWLGNDKIYHITNAGFYRLRIDLQNFKGAWYYAEYGMFYIGSEEGGYRLHITKYSGTAGDSMSHSNGRKFTTTDRDNDNNGHGNCADFLSGGWWYGSCSHSALNAKYGNKVGRYIYWNTGSGWPYSIKTVVMKMRPVLR